MPRARFANLDPDRRREILDRAAADFAEHGYERASLNRILASTGLSKGSFYYYFDDKADLLGSVMEQAFAEVARVVDDLDVDLTDLRAESFWDQLRDWSERATPRFLEIPYAVGLAKLVYHQAPELAGLSQAVEEQMDNVRGWVARLIRRGRELGVIRDDLPTGLQEQMVLGALQGADRWFVDHWERLESTERDRLNDATLAAIRRLLDPEGVERAVPAPRSQEAHRSKEEEVLS